MPEADTDRKSALLDAAADAVLAEGTAILGVRALGARLGTSGRMLLYYFETRDALVTAVLARISGRLAAALAARPQGEGGLGAPEFLDRALMLAADPEIRPFMRVWTEVVSRAAQGEAPYGAVAEGTVGAWLAWIASRLAPDLPPEAAVAILAMVDGATLLELARPGTTAGLRDYLARARP